MFEARISRHAVQLSSSLPLMAVGVKGTMRVQCGLRFIVGGHETVNAVLVNCQNCDTYIIRRHEPSHFRTRS